MVGENSKSIDLVIVRYGTAKQGKKVASKTSRKFDQPKPRLVRP